MAYAIITVLLFFFLTIAHDLRTGNGKYTILPNGHCNHDTHSYKTLFLTDISVSIHKLVQIIMFVSYLVYFYKFKKRCNAQTGSGLQYDKVLFKIAIGMGATIGLSNFIWTLVIFAPKYINIVIVIISGGILLLIQQCVVMTSFLCIEKMSRLCKDCLSKDENYY